MYFGIGCHRQSRPETLHNHVFLTLWLARRGVPLTGASGTAPKTSTGVGDDPESGWFTPWAIEAVKVRQQIRHDAAYFAELLGFGEMKVGLLALVARSDTKISPIPSSNCFVSTVLVLSPHRSRSNGARPSRVLRKEPAMAQVGQLRDSSVRHSVARNTAA